MKKRGESKEAKRGNAGMNSFSWCHIDIFHFFKTSQGFQPLPQEAKEGLLTGAGTRPMKWGGATTCV